MQYLLLIYSEESAWTESEMQACFEQSTAIYQELATQGKCSIAQPLDSVNTATSVRVREGKRLITDGPFAETREQLGGFYLIDVDNLDEAIAIAERLPPAKKGTVEIRPLFTIPG